MNNMDNRISQDNSLPSLPNNNSPNLPMLASPYGFRQFRDNQEASAFVNMSLNAGPGFIGTVAAARNLSAGMGNMSLDGILNSFRRGEGQTGQGQGQGRQQGALSNIGRPVALHGSRSLPFSNSRIRSHVPTPASAMLLLVNVDTPIRSNNPSNGVTRRFNNSPPTPSASSMVSFGSRESVLSVSSSPCSCPNCSGCKCHLYCHEHALLRCPVHGDGGMSSSDESGFASQSSNCSSTTTHSSTYF